MPEKLGNKGAMSEVESEPKKIDILDFVISSYDDFMHSKKPSADKTSVDIALENSLPAIEKKCWSDELTNPLSVSSDNDFVFNENNVIPGNLKQDYNTFYLEEKIQKLQKINDNLKKSVIEMQSSLNNNPMRRGTREMSMPLPKVALYKTQMCNLWNANQFCSYGSKCWFAHGSHELRHFLLSVPQAIQPPLQNRLSQSVDRVSFSLPKVDLYKTRMCDSWNANRFCSYGNKCWFAHGSDELRYSPNASPAIQPPLHSRPSQSIDRVSFPLPKVALYKTQMCNSWSANQFCSHGKKCWFAHGSGELRPLPPRVPRAI